MKYKYYPNATKFITKGLKNKFPKVKSKEDLGNIPAHLLWMMGKMQTFNDSGKAARWFGWILAHAEILGIMDNEKSRELVRKDLRENK